MQVENNIYLGKWEPHEKLLNKRYNSLVQRIRNFAQEAGLDPYNRQFAAEQLIDFVLAKNISDKSIDYMYRHYVYYKLSQVYKIDIERLELDDLYTDFVLFPENKKIKLKML